MKWLDIEEIAIELAESYPDQDPLTVNFVWLRDAILGLKGFDDDPNKGGERILEAIQQAWIDELD